VIVGGLNWGLVGLFKFNLVNAILGGVPTVERIVYFLVGFSAVLMLFPWKCKKCGGSCCKGEDKSCCGGVEKKF